MAYAIPVFPLVASKIVLPGSKSPLAIPALIILSAARSLTEPPGLHHSAFAKISTFARCAATRSIRSNGVLPIRSSTPSTLCSRREADSSVRRWRAWLVAVPSSNNSTYRISDQFTPNWMQIARRKINHPAGACPIRRLHAGNNACKKRAETLQVVSGRRAYAESRL